MTRQNILLTDDQQATFIKEGAKLCPLCNTGRLFTPVRPRYTADNKVLSLRECPDCRAIIVVEYVLVGIVSITEQRKEDDHGQPSRPNTARAALRDAAQADPDAEDADRHVVP
jgi:hypothetical protein